MVDQPILSYIGVGRVFDSSNGRVEALGDFSVDIAPGEFVSIVGPSGCGKSTILNMTVGLLAPSKGTIEYRGKTQDGIESSIGYVTQKDNLYPWRTILDNVAFGLEVRGVSKKRRRAMAREMLRTVGLEGFEGRYPHELSGGMRQRAHIARTLVYGPEAILMDEPFGPLDVQTRLQSQQLLLDLWEKQRSTVVFITHDLGEAISLSDRVIVLTRRPARVLDVIEVDIPRPRDMYTVHTTPEFRSLYDPLWTQLMDEMKV